MFRGPRDTTMTDGAARGALFDPAYRSNAISSTIATTSG
jgi:hypothetical protein